MRFLAAALTAALLLTASPFTVRADAGGDDAPGSWADARDVRPGSYSSTLGGEGDDADWFRVELPAGMGGRVSLFVPEPQTRHALVLLDDEGHYLNGDWSGRGSVTLESFARGALRIGILAGPVRDDGTGNGTGDATPFGWHLDVQTFRAPDFAIEDLRVTNRALRTDLADVPPGHLRTVHVDVANLAGAGQGWLSLHVETPSDGRTTFLGYAYLHLAEGETRSVSIDWDAKGIVGDVTVHAFAWADGDADASNGYAQARHYVVLGGTGEGYTLSPSSEYACAPVPFTTTCAGLSRWEGWTYASAYHAGPAGSLWTDTWTDGHYAGVFANGNATPGGASVYATRDLQHGGGFASVCLANSAGAKCRYSPLP